MTLLNLAMRLLILLPAAGFVLAACTASTTISGVDIAHNYQSIELGRFHGGDNALRVVVYGDPFGDPPERVSRAIVAGMQGHNGGPRVTFSAAPAPPPKPRWRVVMAINPTDVTLSDDLCKLTGTPATARSVGGQIRIVGAYCQGDFAASRATGRAQSVGGLASANLDSMLALMTHSLFPAHNPHDERRCRFFPCRL